ncbi:MAG: hypothetical protein ACI9QD_000379 [Thermoproteota archaeon]|jgi:hypothetical protein
MLQKLKQKNQLLLMKNGVYYISKDEEPVLNYLDLIELSSGVDTFKDYISYRLDSTNRNLTVEQKNHIIEKMRSKLIAFKERRELIEDIANSENWLYMPTFLLLSQGGDDRSTIDPITLKNKYHSKTLPFYDFQRSSCTSSSISLETYLHLEQNHFDLMAANALGEIEPKTLFQNQNDEILSYFVTHAIRDKVSILSTPSGTDVEFLCTWLGILRAAEFFGSDGINVSVFVNGDLEVGSGTKLATGLKHFSSRAPQGNDLDEDIFVSKLDNVKVSVQSFYTRDDKTNVYNSAESEEKIYDMVKKEVESNKIVVFHYVHASKTGVCIPSYDMAKKIKEDFGNKVIMVVDAAQMRLRTDSVEQYLEMGMNIIVTGSKFIGGAPFSGALLVNEKDSKTFLETNIKLPSEFDQYFDQFGVSELVKREESQIDWSNWGLYMRWEVALHEMKQFDRIPLEFANRFIYEWGKSVEKMIESDKIVVNILKESALLPSDDSSLSNANSIVPFEIVTNPKLTLIQLKKIHARMTIKRTRDDIICEIGQPVQISTGDNKRYALRVALGAKNVIDAYRGTKSYHFDDCLEYLLGNDKKLLNKLFDLIEDEIENGRN